MTFRCEKISASQCFRSARSASVIAQRGTRVDCIRWYIRKRPLLFPGTTKERQLGGGTRKKGPLDFLNQHDWAFSSTFILFDIHNWRVCYYHDFGCRHDQSMPSYFPRKMQSSNWLINRNRDGIQRINWNRQTHPIRMYFVAVSHRLRDRHVS